ncbi:MAG: proline dehydrogenase family protein [Nocardioides sp.]
MLRTSLRLVANSPRVRRAITTSPLSSQIAGRYIPGESLEVAARAARGVVDGGLRATMNCLGEDITDADAVEAIVQTYLALLDELNESGLARHTELSIKLSALGLALEVADPLAVAVANSYRIARAAHRAGTMITIDMEHSRAIDDLLAVLKELRADFPRTGAALAAYLHRTEADCRALAYEGSRVRLCKGAYAESPDLAFQSRADIDRSFVRCLRTLMAGQAYPMIATHDGRMIDIAAALASRHDRNKAGYEFQFLYGIRTEEQSRLAAAGETVRVYIPYGEQWYGYLVRRLAGRPLKLSAVAASVATTVAELANQQLAIHETEPT